MDVWSITCWRRLLFITINFPYPQNCPQNPLYHKGKQTLSVDMAIAGNPKDSARPINCLFFELYNSALLNFSSHVNGKLLTNLWQEKSCCENAFNILFLQVVFRAEREKSEGKVSCFGKKLGDLIGRVKKKLAKIFSPGNQTCRQIWAHS